MEDKIKDIVDKIARTNDVFEKIDLQNKLAWRFRLSDTNQSLDLANQTQNSSLKAGYRKGLAESLKNQAFAYQILLQYELCFKKASEGIALYRELNNRTGEADIINILGNSSFTLGDYENSLKYNLQALQIREETNDVHGKVLAYITIGNIFLLRNDTEVAANNYLRGLEFVKSYPGKISGEANLFTNLGLAYYKLGKFEKALECLYKGLELGDIDNDPAQLIISLHNLADILLKTGEPEAAEKHLLRGLEIAVAKGIKFGEASTLIGLGEVASYLKKNEDALKYLEKALTIVESFSFKKILPEIFLELSEIMFRQKNYEKALFYHKRFYEVKEKEFNEEEHKKIQSLLILHQVDTLKKESEVQRISNDMLKKLNEEIENKNRSIFESIDYAKHIQNSILPHSKSLKQYFSESFVLNSPKDVISGDFFWIYEKENHILVAAIDCTGHGVSGALMSIVANSLLNQVTSSHWVPSPSLILDEINYFMERTLTAHDESGLRDSMAVSLCAISKTKTGLVFTGTQNPLYIISGGALKEYKGDNISMGNSASAKFTGHPVKLTKGDCLYIFTDGFADQIGGPERKTLNSPAFENLLLKIHMQPMEKQKELLLEAMNDWMGKEKQTDDILIIGIKI